MKYIQLAPDRFCSGNRSNLPS